MKNLKEKWRLFCGIVLSPGSVIFIILTVGSLFLSVHFLKNKELSILLAVLGSLFGGVAGSFIKDDHNKIFGENTLEKKGRSALRNLQSIGKQLRNIRFWITGFSKEKVSRGQKKVLSEIDRHISTAQMNIESGFEDWVDIIPELSEGTERVAEITKKQQEVLQAYVEELLKKKKELIVSKDKKRVDELKKHISILEKQIKEIRSDSTRSIGASIPLSATSINGNRPLTLGSSVVGAPDSIILSGIGSRCANCGKDLKQHNISALSTVSVYDSYCDECKKKLFNS